MLRRLASAYLWIAPLMIAPLWYAYHLAGLGAGIAFGAVHLLLMALGMWARGVFDWAELPTAFGLTRLLLISGGGIVWMIGAAGPPRRHDVTLALYNNTGLILGIFIILCGFAALKDELQTEKRGALAAVGQAIYSFAFVAWILECFVIWAKLQAPAAGLPEAQQPDWLLFISPVWYGMDLLRFGSAYVGSAAFAAAGILTGRIPRLPGWIMIAFSLIAAVLGIFTDLPFFIPALTCLVPYFLGMTLRRSDNLNFQKKAGR
jgi:hypothetical protein